MNKKTPYLIASILIILTIIILIEKFGNSPIIQNTDKAPTNTANYLCENNKKIHADFFAGEQKEIQPNEQPTPTGTIKLTFENGTITNLNQTISADGGRYSNKDESFVFWDKGNGAMILENNEEKNYKGCITIAKISDEQNLPQTYLSTKNNFTIRLPEGYTIDESYSYDMNPKTKIDGTKFTIPSSTATGTNLGSDTHISFEKIPNTEICAANMFLDFPNVTAKNITDNGRDYSFETVSDAGAGNRYEETIYAYPFMTDCFAVRYFIHYGVFENYPTGMIKEFNKQKLLDTFDEIRRTIVNN